MKEKSNGDVWKGTLGIEFERDWSVGLGATLGEGHTENFKYIYFYNFRNFSGKSL